MIVIPMAGESRRFAEAGYRVPKYRLEAQGRTVFAHAVGSFAAYFATDPFLFVVRGGGGAAGFVRDACAAMGVQDARVAVLDRPSGGQAETVALGLDKAGVPDNQPVTIFNIDTFRPGYRHPDFGSARTDGWLEVFRGSGDNWSYVRPAAPGGDIAAETAEKRPISDLCCTGMYHFARAGLFRRAYQGFYAGFAPGPELRERYVAPVYNQLIAQGMTIRYRLIERSEVVFCGVPAEYEAFVAGSPG